MGPWLQSGRRRDICVLLAGSPDDECTGQRLKSRLEAHYDERLEPRSFYGSVSALVDAGLVTNRSEGIQEYYALTPAGRERLEAHDEWLRSHLSRSAGAPTDE